MNVEDQEYGHRSVIDVDCTFAKVTVGYARTDANNGGAPYGVIRLSVEPKPDGASVLTLQEAKALKALLEAYAG